MSDKSSKQPDIQLFCNLVIRRRGDGAILFVKPDPAEERWWLPWADLEPYQHPDDAVQAALKKLAGLEVARTTMAQVQSFRGRAGWHVTFDYLVEAAGDPKTDQNPQWFPADKPPRTVHGEWEKGVVRDVIAKADGLK
jgi:ADP-ribose pyrophosphatase YjhB (NUDIX family)